MGSLLLEIARECAVPAGHALAVDRAQFSARVTEAISREPLIQIRREEVIKINEDEITIIATGPLTSDALAEEIARLSTAGVARTGVSDPHKQLYFYDSISPIVEADSIDMSKVYLAARYDKGSADYINCPMSKEEYDRFYDAMISADSVEAKDVNLLATELNELRAELTTELLDLRVRMRKLENEMQSANAENRRAEQRAARRAQAKGMKAKAGGKRRKSSA